MKYDNALHLIITATLTLLYSGCTTSVERHYTKDEARASGGMSEIGTDLCDLEGWYADGECDDFCVEADSDCGECAAVPTCGAGEVAHERWEDCPADASCREVMLCGATIWCSDTATCAAVPSCREGEIGYWDPSECPADASCRSETMCGSTIWCFSDEAPVCAGENPQGCFDGMGCADGFVCDTEMTGAPSACDCDPETGSWVCTPDLSGGTCVPAGG